MDCHSSYHASYTAPCRTIMDSRYSVHYRTSRTVLWTPSGTTSQSCVRLILLSHKGRIELSYVLSVVPHLYSILCVSSYRGTHIGQVGLPYGLPVVPHLNPVSVLSYCPAHIGQVGLSYRLPVILHLYTQSYVSVLSNHPT